MDSAELRIEQVRATVTVVFAGRRIAYTQRPVVVREVDHTPVYYIPLADVASAALESSTRRSFCPRKGHAVYWHLHGGGRRAENAAWTYAEPLPGRELLRDYVAFYTECVDALRVAPTGALRTAPTDAHDAQGGESTPR